jgi:hypothetical protein
MLANGSVVTMTHGHRKRSAIRRRTLSAEIHLSERKDARTSSEKTSGCSQAA